MNKQTLYLPLKKEWFAMTKAGIKKEEYREVTPFWCNRLVLVDGKPRHKDWWEFHFNYQGLFLLRSINEELEKGTMQFRQFTVNKMTLGYPSKSDKERIVELKHKGIEIMAGEPEWGAEENKLYFVIRHGEVLQTQSAKK